MKIVTPLKMSAFAAILALPAWAWAKAPDLVSFKKAYPQYKNPTCKVCHTNRMPQLNPYGLDYANSDRSFISIEELDSDGDGFLNIDEINASSNPGERDSVPPVSG